MGISNLYKFLAPCVKDGHIRELRGKTIAVDMPCWVHRGAIADAQKIVMGGNQVGSAAVDKFVTKRLTLLKQHNINAICVFDGQRLSSKKDTNEKRGKSRDEAKSKAIQALKEGNGGKAYGLFCQAIHISREINQSAQNVCRKLGFPVIVAPYEADAQLAFLSTSGIIDAVMTEDSDLFIFGTKELIIKLDDSGHCKVVSADQISHVDSLATFNNPIRWLRYACIMQGCDYYPKGLPGIGLKTGVKLLAKAYGDQVHDFSEIFKNKRKYFSSKMLEKWDHDAEERIIKAEETFKYQLILNTKTKQLQPITDYPEGKTWTDYEHCGNLLEAEIHAKNNKKDALGVLNNISIQPSIQVAKVETEFGILPVRKAEKRKSESHENNTPKQIKREVKRDTSWRIDTSVNSKLEIPMNKKTSKPMKPIVPKKLKIEDIEKELNKEESEEDSGSKSPVIPPVQKSKYFRKKVIEPKIEVKPKIEIQSDKIQEDSVLKTIGLVDSDEDEFLNTEIKVKGNTKESTFDKIFSHTSPKARPKPSSPVIAHVEMEVVNISKPMKKIDLTKSPRNSSQKKSQSKISNFFKKV